MCVRERCDLARRCPDENVVRAVHLMWCESRGPGADPLHGDRGVLLVLEMRVDLQAETVTYWLVSAVFAGDEYQEKQRENLHCAPTDLKSTRHRRLRVDSH